MIPHAHTTVNRAQLDADRKLLATHTPIEPPLHLITYFVLIVCILFGLALLASPVGAAERPKVDVVEIVKVTGANPLYYVTLADNRILIVAPSRRAPELTVGTALLDGKRLIQNSASYRITMIRQGRVTK